MRKLLFLLLLLLPVTTTEATVVRIRYNSLGPSSRAKVWVDGEAPVTGYFGLHNLETDSGEALHGFCIDPYQGVPLDFEIYHFSLLTENKGRYAQELLNKYYNPGWESSKEESDTATALNLALLEVVYEKYQEDPILYNVDSYFYEGKGFRCESPVNNLANDMLHNLTGIQIANISILSNRRYQDYVPVPEPATYILLSIGIVFEIIHFFRKARR